MDNKSSLRKFTQEQSEAVCDGGGGAMGHPKIYLPFGKKTEVICYYCGKRFEKNNQTSG